MAEVVIPSDLQAALNQNPELRNYFISMPPSHQREYIKYISEAKQPETRARRLATSLDLMRAKAGRRGAA